MICGSGAQWTVTFNEKRMKNQETVLTQAGMINPTNSSTTSNILALYTGDNLIFFT